MQLLKVVWDEKVSHCRRPLKLCFFNISVEIENLMEEDFHRMLNFSSENLMMFKYFHSIEIIGIDLLIFLGKIQDFSTAAVKAS